MAFLPRSLACWLLVACSSWTIALAGKSTDHLVVVVLSGLPAGRFSVDQSPNLLKAAREGASMTVRSAFPTENLPNQYSLVTGLSPAVHGVLWNRMVDAESDDEKIVDVAVTGDSVLLSGEPIWKTAKKERIRTAVFTSGDIKTENFLENPCAKCSPEAVLDKLLAWVSSSIKSNASAPTLSFVTLPAVSISRFDAIVEKFMEDLREQHLDGLVNIILTGDHGLVADVQRDVVCLSTLLAGLSYDVIDYSGGAVSLRPTSNDTVTGLIDRLKKDSRISSQAAYDFVHQYSHGHLRRVAPVTILAKNDRVVLMGKDCDLNQEITSRTAQLMRSGYRSKEAMTTEAVAIGPRFARGVSSRSVNITDLHAVMCAVLRLTTGHCTGTLPHSVQSMLAVQSMQAVLQTSTPLSGGDNHVADEASATPRVPSHREVTGFGIFVIILCGIVFVGGIFWMKNYFAEKRRRSGGNYHLVKNGFEPDLSLRTEPLLSGECDPFNSDSLQLSVLGEKSYSHMISDDDDDDGAHNTYTI